MGNGSRCSSEIYQMKLRTYLADNFGGIKEALAKRSTIAAVLHGLDVKAGKRGAFSNRAKVNPFCGIACASPRKAKHERHVEGARDTNRPFRYSWSWRESVSFRTNNPTPACFTE